MTSRVPSWGPAALWAAVLFLLSELEGSSAGLPGGVDKLAHGALYAILGLSLAWGRARTGFGVSKVLLLVIGAGYGALDEWHQSFVPGRQASLWDWVADFAGVTIGLMLFSRFGGAYRDRRAPNGATTRAVTTTFSD